MLVLPCGVLSHSSPEAAPLSRPSLSLPSTPFQVTRPTPPNLRMSALVVLLRSSSREILPSWLTNSPSIVHLPYAELAPQIRGVRLHVARDVAEHRIELTTEREAVEVVVPALGLVLEVDAVVEGEVAAVDGVLELLRRVHLRDHAHPAVLVVAVVEIERVALVALVRRGLVRDQAGQPPVGGDHRAELGPGDLRREADAIDAVTVVGVEVVRAVDRVVTAAVVEHAHAPVIRLAAELEDAERDRDLGPRALDRDRVCGRC